MNLKQAYEDYKFIKDNQEGDESKLEGARAFLNETLATTSGVLANIHSYQKVLGLSLIRVLQTRCPPFL